MIVREDSPSVRHLVVYAKGKTESEEKTQTSLDVDTIIQKLQTILPDYLIPAAIVEMNDFPVAKTSMSLIATSKPIYDPRAATKIAKSLPPPDLLANAKEYVPREYANLRFVKPPNYIARYIRKKEDREKKNVKEVENFP